MNNYVNHNERLSTQFILHLLEPGDTEGYLHITPAERLSCYEIIWLQDGHWPMQVNGHSLQLEAAMACMLIPGQVRQLHAPGNIRGYRLIFSTEYFYLTAPQCGLVNQSNFLQQPWMRRLEPQLADFVHMIFAMLQKECGHTFSPRRSMLQGWLKLLLTYLDWGEELVQKDTRKSREEVLSGQFFKLLSQHFVLQKKVSDYAKILGITPTHLNQVIKRTSGHPASYHIQQYIILEAKRQATHTDKSMKEIAYALGFDDVAHFSKFFKHNAGVNFTGFKKEMPGVL